jgi:hypothetical protein
MELEPELPASLDPEDPAAAIPMVGIVTITAVKQANRNNLITLTSLL